MSDPNIVCKRCGYRETLNKRFILKILGGAFAGGGFWAWVAYFLPEQVWLFLSVWH